MAAALAPSSVIVLAGLAARLPSAAVTSPFTSRSASTRISTRSAPSTPPAAVAPSLVKLSAKEPANRFTSTSLTCAAAARVVGLLATVSIS